MELLRESIKCALLNCRNVVERSIGVWKRRFSCLNWLRTKPARAITIIAATAVLHNMARQAAVPLPELEEDEIEDQPQQPYEGPLNDGQAIRNAFTQYFI